LVTGDNSIELSLFLHNCKKSA